MDKIKYHIPQFILGVLFGILVVAGVVYLSGLGHKIDRIYSIMEVDRVNFEIEVKSNQTIGQ